MAEGAAAEAKGEIEKNTAAGGGYPSLVLKIWPPTQRTREAVLHRLVETLTSQSVLSKRYGSLPGDEAAAVAGAIEEEAFTAASAASVGGGADDDGIEVLHVYSQEISRRMVESAKARAVASAAAPNS
ncbi:hypothetical protein C4D60_Mb09t08560 [Musa balbisiana]|uniref:WPP domain-containing protein n=1 Tax=Musa balbisiana TaxID=52838 RepID=A0A4S8IEZ1_MUSBA|nr:hypothetical protein C4D60_Mb09t08560 [Musa balbisiana]